jgi:hypothetical protein
MSDQEEEMNVAVGDRIEFLRDNVLVTVDVCEEDGQMVLEYISERPRPKSEKELKLALKTKRKAENRRARTRAEIEEREKERQAKELAEQEACDVWVDDDEGLIKEKEFTSSAMLFADEYRKNFHKQDDIKEYQRRNLKSVKKHLKDPRHNRMAPILNVMDVASETMHSKDPNLKSKMVKTVQEPLKRIVNDGVGTDKASRRRAKKRDPRARAFLDDQSLKPIEHATPLAQAMFAKVTS